MISLVGDISLNGLISTEAELNKRRFHEISTFLQNHYTIANLESPFSSVDIVSQVEGIINYALADPGKNLLKELSINCVSLANNHMLDLGLAGLRETITILDDLNILHTGAGWKQEQLDPLNISIEGQNVGFMAFVDKLTHPIRHDEKNCMINLLSIQKIKNQIDKLKPNTDYIICSLHWGKDYSNFFSKSQQDLAHTIIDLGVDLIMGHHSHTIQAVEKYKNKTIFYSLGGLCYGDFEWEGKLRALKRKTKTGMIAKLGSDMQPFKLQATLEKKGNFIQLSDKNLKVINEKRLRRSRQIIKYPLIKSLIKIKEGFLDRLSEYFFGYYRNPIIQLFSLHNLKKLNYIKRDLKS